MLVTLCCVPGAPLQGRHPTQHSSTTQGEGNKTFSCHRYIISSFLLCSSSQGMVVSRPHRSSLTIPASPSPLYDISMHTPLEADIRQSCHTHSESYSSRHSGMAEGHVRQESGLSRHSHHSALVDPMSSVEPPVHPRQVHSLDPLTLTHLLVSSCRDQ